MTELVNRGFTEGLMYGMAMSIDAKPEDSKMLDFEKAYQICQDNQNSTVYAGLAEDWMCTGGRIWADGKPAKDYCFFASGWATPVVVVEGMQPIDCYKTADGTAVSSEDWHRFCVRKEKGSSNGHGAQ